MHVYERRVRHILASLDPTTACARITCGQARSAWMSRSWEVLRDGEPYCPLTHEVVYIDALHSFP